MVVVSMAYLRGSSAQSSTSRDRQITLSSDEFPLPTAHPSLEVDGSNCESSNKNDTNNLSVFGIHHRKAHLKDLISLQLDLIEHQQLKISRKDKQIILLKSEKEQLEARLNRMERRLSLQKRQTLDPDDVSSLKTKGLHKSNSSCFSPALNLKKNAILGERGPLSPSVPVTVSSRLDKAFKFNTYLRTNESFLDVAKTKFLAGLDHYIQKEKESANTVNIVSVPPWKIVEKRDLNTLDEQEDEDVSNEAFLKRHTKPEVEEKRRKRWDLQQLRQQRQHEMLVQKYNERERKTKSGTESDLDAPSSIQTLYKNPEYAMAIEISNIVPVCAFGHPLPAVKTSELQLPWFSIARRENQLRQKSKQKDIKRLKSSRRESKKIYK